MVKSAGLTRPNLPNDVAGWLEFDRQYRIRGRYDISQVLVRGKGVSVWDADGKEYIDFESGQVCTSTGHCHPAYTQAIIRKRCLARTFRSGSRGVMFGAGEGSDTCRFQTINICRSRSGGLRFSPGSAGGALGLL